MNGDVFTEQDAEQFLKRFKVWEFVCGEKKKTSRSTTSSREVGS